MKQQFTIGTEFKRRNKDYIETVTDVLTTTNMTGEVVAIRYVCDHEFCGQTVVDRDVVATTIAMGQLQ